MPGEEIPTIAPNLYTDHDVLSLLYSLKTGPWEEEKHKVSHGVCL